MIFFSWTDHSHIILFGVRSKCHKIILNTAIPVFPLKVLLFGIVFDYEIYILQNGNELVRFKLVYMVLMYVKMAASAVIYLEIIIFFV